MLEIAKSCWVSAVLRFEAGSPSAPSCTSWRPGPWLSSPSLISEKHLRVVLFLIASLFQIVPCAVLAPLFTWKLVSAVTAGAAVLQSAPSSGQPWCGAGQPCTRAGGALLGSHVGLVIAALFTLSYFWIVAFYLFLIFNSSECWACILKENMYPE